MSNVSEQNHALSDDVYPQRLLGSRLIHVLDDNPDSVEKLSIAFKLEGFETSFTTTPSEFSTYLSRRRPDAVVANISLDANCGRGTIARLRAAHKAVPIFMISSTHKMEEAVIAMREGAADVLGTPVDIEYLVSSVRDALKHDIQFGELRGGSRSVEIRGFGQLTNRQREVLQLLVEGHTNKMVAAALGISSRTIEVHRAAIMRKLGAENAAGLVRIVLTS